MIGRLEGFSFTPDSAADSSEAKALQAAARSALAGEIDARARRLSQAPDREFVLTIDGTLRWVGEAVAKLVAGDDVMRPRLRIVADEQLTGAPREAVQTRLDFWLKSHIERLLDPLFVLALAEDVTGIARGIAFQLVEALGVLERQKVADEVKALDQSARATLRKHGVRFGAYHIYIPALLKPSPRALAVQLWALKHGGPEHGLENLQHLAASGRTSIPVDEKMPKLLYRTVGYCVCGARAIRVDILERLADLIRPALAWRDGSAGTRPAGALDGRAFLITGAMTSLTGASGEDFASILRALGYRMEKRPKPVEPAPPPAAKAAETAELAAAPASDGEAAVVTTPRSDAETVETAVVASDTAEPTIAGESAPSSAGIPAESAIASAVTPPPQTELSSGASPVDGETVVVAAPAAEPETIEVWRPGRPDGPRRKREETRRPPRRRERPAQRKEVQPASEAQATPPEVQAATSEARGTGEPEPARERREKRGRPRPHRPEPGERTERAERTQRAERTKHSEHDRGDSRGERIGRRRERRDRDDDNRSPRTWSSDERRGKEPDPNSPFAKLLALKEQLETNSKERR